MTTSAESHADSPLRRWRKRHSRRFGHYADSMLDSRLLAHTLEKDEHLSRWMGWRLRLLVLAALLGCVAVLMLARWMANQPQLPAHWRTLASGRLELLASPRPELNDKLGRSLLEISVGDQRLDAQDSLSLRRSTRWVTADSDRQQQQALHERLAHANGQPIVTLRFDDGSNVMVRPEPRGTAQLGLNYWVLTALALTLYLIAMVSLLAKPSKRSLLFALMSLCQCGNLLTMAIRAASPLGLPPCFIPWDASARMGFDLVTAGALLHVATLHPRRVPGGSLIAWSGWAAMACIGLAIWVFDMPHRWWWVQSSVAVMGLCMVGMLHWSYRLMPHPFAVVMKRFGMVTVGTWCLLTVAVAMADMEHVPSMQQQIAATGPLVWYVFLALLMMLSPFLSKSQQVMREFSLLAGISTAATALDLLFVAMFSFGQFASVTLALFLSLGLYTGARQWLLNRVRHRNMVTTERMFEKLYRIAREVEVYPERVPKLLSQLLRDLFDPMESLITQKRSKTVRIVSDGSTLLVPIPAMTEKQSHNPSSIVLRFAQRGTRLFTSEDARLSDRIVEQLCRAVAFDRAVEQGRSEERLRIAQDLHDDIGARLLTLMYTAPSPEMEDYVRHTLQDLKTLTRGLAAANHPLSHAAAEWKADLTQRLTAVQIALEWDLSFDQDISLTVVQWSGLTRVMRELVSNVIAHSKATQVDMDFHLERDRLELRVSDDGIGRNPASWTHGLGLGGVRKRVKQLGGEVRWRETDSGGICCEVVIAKLSEGCPDRAR